MIRCDRVIVERCGQMVIDRLSLSIGAGEAVAFIGRAGAGKTTLLEAVATAIPLRGGDIDVAGSSVRRAPDAVRARIGYAPAHLPAWPAVRADHFLALFAASAGLTGPGLAEAVDRALDLAGLRGMGGAAIDGLPAGQAKLLLIGRAMLHVPDVLVLDDPFGNLDPFQRRSIERLIGDMQIGGRTVVAALDDAHVPDCFTRVAVVAAGRIACQGPADFAAFSTGRRWRYRLLCPRHAEAAAAVARRLADDVEICDADTLECMLACGSHASRPPIAGVIEALVRSGIAVESAGPYPHWTIQLLDPPA